MSVLLYELGGQNGLRYSQFAWRTRLALAHKDLAFESRPVAVSDKASIAFSGQDKVPILVDGDRVVTDSWRIAEYLEAQYPDRASLFGGAVGHALARFVNSWIDRQLIPVAVPLFMIDVVARVEPADASHLRAQIERAFGKTLEELAAGRDLKITALRNLWAPIRASLRAQPFLSGAAPAYADYALFSVFQWARLVSDFEPLQPEDAIAAWRERMLDLFDGLARAHPAAAAAAH
jgi:glutathione S-transferase